MVVSNWKISIDSSHVTPLNRQVTEAVKISRASPDILLNSKNEFGANNLPELELRYGTKVGNGGVKRKRRDEEEEEQEEAGLVDSRCHPAGLVDSRCQAAGIMDSRCNAAGLVDSRCHTAGTVDSRCHAAGEPVCGGMEFPANPSSVNGDNTNNVSTSSETSNNTNITAIHRSINKDFAAKPIVSQREEGSREEFLEEDELEDTASEETPRNPTPGVQQPADVDGDNNGASASSLTPSNTNKDSIAKE